MNGNLECRILVTITDPGSGFGALLHLDMLMGRLRRLVNDLPLGFVDGVFLVNGAELSPIPEGGRVQPPSASEPEPKPRRKPGPKPRAEAKAAPKPRRKREPKPDPAGFAAPGGEILTCAACGEKFVAPNAKGPAPKYCKDADCRKARAKAIGLKLYSRKTRVVPPVPDPDDDEDDGADEAEAASYAY